MSPSGNADRCNRLINESVSRWILSKFVHRNFEPKFVQEENNAWFLLSQCRVSTDTCKRLINESVSKWVLSKNVHRIFEPKFVQEENNAWFLLSQCRVSTDTCKRLINESVSKWVLSKNVHRIFEPKFVQEENNAWFLLSRCPVSVESCVTDWLMSLSLSLSLEMNIVQICTTSSDKESQQGASSTTFGRCAFWLWIYDRLTMPHTFIYGLPAFSHSVLSKCGCAVYSCTHLCTNWLSISCLPA